MADFKTLNGYLVKDEYARQEIDNILNNKVFVTPQNYGAAGDDVSDDTTAMQTAINEAVENNYILLIPVGTYRVDALTIKDGLIMMGLDKYNSVIHLMAGSITGDPTNHNLFNNGKISNLTIRGNENITNQNGFNVIMIRSSIENVIAKNFTGTGFLMAEPDSTDWYQPMVNNGESHALKNCSANWCGTGYQLLTWDTFYSDLISARCNIGAVFSSCAIVNMHIWGYTNRALEIRSSVRVTNLEIEASINKSPNTNILITGNNIAINNLYMWNIRVTNYLIFCTTVRNIALNNVVIGIAGTLTDADATRIQFMSGDADYVIANGVIDSSYTSGTCMNLTGSHKKYTFIGNSGINNLTY